MNPLDNITVVLVEPASPGNIGATARVLKNTGISRLALVNPGQWDVPEARWLAHGSEEILDACQVFPDLPSAVAQAHLVVGTTHRIGRFREVLSTPRQAMTELATQAHHHRIALVFGREKDGLWNNELRCCHQLVRIPTAAPYPSLNLSHAVLVFTYELYHALKITEAAPHRHLITASEQERLHQHLMEALEAIEFHPYNDDPDNFARVLQRLLNHLSLERRDAMVIHRICRQIQKFAARHRKLADLAGSVELQYSNDELEAMEEC